MCDIMSNYKRHDGTSNINVGAVSPPIGMPQEVLRALNKLVLILVLIMATVWFGLAAFCIYQFRRPRRAGGSSSLENAIELYEIRRPHRHHHHHPAEPELLIFGTAEDRQRRFPHPPVSAVPAPAPAPAPLSKVVAVPVILEEYEEGAGDDSSVTVWEDSSAMKD